MGHAFLRAVLVRPAVLVVVVVVERCPALGQSVIKAGGIDVRILFFAVAHLIVAARIGALPADGGSCGRDVGGGDVGHHCISHIDGDAGDGLWLRSDMDGWREIGHIALYGAEALDVIAVFDGDEVRQIVVVSTREGGTAVAINVNLAGREEAVCEFDGSPVVALFPAYESAPVVGGCANQLTVEGTVGEGDGCSVINVVLTVGHEAAVGAVAVDAAVDDDAAEAVGDSIVVERKTGEACGEHLSSIDGASDGEVVDVGTLDIAERGAEVLAERLLGCAVAHGQRLAVAVEVALELVAFGAHHRRDSDAVDVVGQLVVGGVEAEDAVVHLVGELVPLCGAADDVGAFRGA